jgi:hypothetical protein
MGALLQSRSAPQLEKEEQQAREAENAKVEHVEVIDNLAAHVRTCWTAAKTHRSRQPDRYTKCLRLRKGEYSSKKLAEIHALGGADTYMNIVGTKCRAAKAWLSDLYAGSGDKPFQITPTPVPELDPSIRREMIEAALQVAMQTGMPQENIEAILEQHEERIKDEVLKESETRMEGMSDYIEDILTEGDFRREFESFLDDLVTYPVAIFKGSIYRKEKKLQWVQDEQGNFKPKMSDKVARKFKRVSPFDFYQSPSMTNIGDSWHIEHIRFSPQELAKMRTSKGYNAKNITMCLVNYREGGLREWAFESGERERLEGKSSMFSGDYELIDGLEFTGYIQGQQLIDWGIEQVIDDPYNEYSVSVTVIGGYTIKAVINPDPTGRPNYYKASFRSVPGSFAGEALTEILEDIQGVCNATIRALVNNMAIGAQPQVAVDISMQAPGTTITSIKPGKSWTYSSKAGQTGPGIKFFSPEIKSQELLGVYERFERYADNISGIPAYAYGSDDAAGAGKTASGLSMLMNASSKTIKSIVRDVDIGVIEPLVSNLYQSAMLDTEVPNDIKGDAQVSAKGSDALMHKEATAMRQLEFMNMTNNPVDMQIVGLEGRREMLETASKNSEFPAGRVIPSLNDFNKRMMANAQPDPNAADPQQTDSA